MAFDNFKRKLKGADSTEAQVDASLENSPTGTAKKVKGANVFMPPNKDKKKRQNQSQFGSPIGFGQ
jgi:hypothetical protein